MDWLDTGKVIGTPPIKPLNAAARGREYLTAAEIGAMLAEANARDGAMIQMAFKHGLRCAELRTLQWSQIDVSARTLAVRRAKAGIAATHPITADTAAALRRYAKAHGSRGVYVFPGRGDKPLSARAVHKIVAAAGRAAKLPLTVHPHMLRHACGYALAAANVPTRTIQLYLGHRSIQSTEIYTAMAPGAFNSIWG